MSALLSFISAIFSITMRGRVGCLISSLDKSCCRCRLSDESFLSNCLGKADSWPGRGGPFWGAISGRWNRGSLLLRCCCCCCCCCCWYACWLPTKGGRWIPCGRGPRIPGECTKRWFGGYSGFCSWPGCDDLGGKEPPGGLGGPYGLSCTNWPEATGGPREVRLSNRRSSCPGRGTPIGPLFIEFLGDSGGPCGRGWEPWDGKGVFGFTCGRTARVAYTCAREIARSMWFVLANRFDRRDWDIHFIS